MSSDSASGRSNGSRFVSANAEIRKISHAIVHVNAFHDSGANPTCRSTTSLSDTFPASSSTGMVAIPIAISYEIICALDRRPPSNEYLLFDDQPASTMPYTPSDASARMKRNPMGSGASASSIRPHGESHGAPNGITAHVSSAGMKAIAGASMKSGV